MHYRVRDGPPPVRLGSAGGPPTSPPLGEGRSAVGRRVHAALTTSAQSSNRTLLFVKSRIASITCQLGRTRPRRYRLTVARSRLMASATSPSLRLLRTM